jgi:hypothetical protein
MSSYGFLTFYATTYHDSNIPAFEIVDNRLGLHSGALPESLMFPMQ